MIDNRVDIMEDISVEDLEAAADMFDGLLNGSFYDDQAEAERYLRQGCCSVSDH